MTRLRSGEDFARVAAEVSDAPDGLSGGTLGWRPLDRLPALFAEAVRQHAAGRDFADPAQRRRPAHRRAWSSRRGGGEAAVQQLEQTRARHILIKTSEVLSDTDAEARLRAIRERVVNGADFGELAKASSADLSAAKGGDLGWLNPGDTVPEFERAMNALQPGEVSPPVRSPFGWHLIQVMERRVQDVTDERKRCRRAPGPARAQGRAGLRGLGAPAARQHLRRLPPRARMSAPRRQRRCGAQRRSSPSPAASRLASGPSCACASSSATGRCAWWSSATSI